MFPIVSQQGVPSAKGCSGNGTYIKRPGPGRRVASRRLRRRRTRLVCFFFLARHCFHQFLLRQSRLGFPLHHDSALPSSGLPRRLGWPACRGGHTGRHGRARRGEGTVCSDSRHYLEMLTIFTAGNRNYLPVRDEGSPVFHFSHWTHGVVSVYLLMMISHHLHAFTRAPLVSSFAEADVPSGRCWQDGIPSHQCLK